MSAAPFRFLVWGAGGHGRVVADALLARGHEVVGFVDADPEKIGDQSLGISVVLEEIALLDRIGAGQPLPRDAHALALGIGDNAARKSALDAVPTSLLPAIVHPGAVVSPFAILGPGSIVLASAVVNAGARIGAGVIVNTGAIVEHDCTLAAAAHISPGAVVAGGARIGRRTWIGAGATVLPGIHVEDDAVVGAGATVIRRVPRRKTVIGVPARAIEDRP